MKLRALVSMLCVAWAQAAVPADATPKAPLPDNAILTRDGSGWDCARGFTRSTSTCAEVRVPANGFLNSAGNDWECRRGFFRKRDACIAVQIPVGAHADDT